MCESIDRNDSLSLCLSFRFPASSSDDGSIKAKREEYIHTYESDGLRRVEVVTGHVVEKCGDIGIGRQQLGISIGTAAQAAGIAPPESDADGRAPELPIPFN
jgi:hypothetical protein